MFGYFDVMIEQFTFWILSFFGSLYIILHWMLWNGSKRLFRPNHQGPLHALSVIVAARNEEKNIGSLLDSLTSLQYPTEKFEIIIVNDRSTDSTADVVESFRKTNSQIRLITIETNTSEMPHKKNALRAGITEAKFEILVFTDADCVVGKEWLRSISDAFTEETGVVAGYSPYHAGSSSAFLRYEENKNSLTAAFAVGSGHAYMCTGRNFAYRKKVYKEVNGFERIKQSISGDDDLFLQVVQRVTEWKIRYMTAAESFVRTIPPDSFRQFVNQRTRHVSASSYYPRTIQTGYGIMHLFHLAIITALFISPFYGLVALMVKLNVDGAFIAYGKKIFGEEFTLSDFVRSELLLVLYTFLIAPLGLIRTFDWKESGKS